MDGPSDLQHPLQLSPTLLITLAGSSASALIPPAFVTVWVYTATVATNPPAFRVQSRALRRLPSTMEPKTPVLHSAEASPRVQCSPPHSPPEARLQPPLVLRHHSHSDGTEGKPHKPHPCLHQVRDTSLCLAFPSSYPHYRQYLKQAERQKPMRHSTEHPLPWGEDEGPREKCQLSSSTLQEHMWDRSSLTTPRHMPRSSRASIHNRRMLLKIPRNRQFQEPLLLWCQRPPAAIWPVTICSMAFNEFFMKEPSPPWEGYQRQSRPFPCPHFSLSRHFWC